MELFNKSFTLETKVKLPNEDGYRKILEIHDSRKWIKIEGVTGSLQRGHIESYSNKEIIFKMTEKQNFQSERASINLNAKTLISAKREATRKQCSHGTILEITNARNHTVAVKQKDGAWIEQEYLD